MSYKLLILSRMTDRDLACAALRVIQVIIIIIIIAQGAFCSLNPFNGVRQLRLSIVYDLLDHISTEVHAGSCVPQILWGVGVLLKSAWFGLETQGKMLFFPIKTWLQQNWFETLFLRFVREQHGRTTFFGRMLPTRWTFVIKNGSRAALFKKCLFLELTKKNTWFKRRIEGDLKVSLSTLSGSPQGGLFEQEWFQSSAF